MGDRRTELTRRLCGAHSAAFCRDAVETHTTVRVLNVWVIIFVRVRPRQEIRIPSPGILGNWPPQGVPGLAGGSGSGLRAGFTAETIPISGLWSQACSVGHSCCIYVVGGSRRRKHASSRRHEADAPSPIPGHCTAIRVLPHAQVG